MADDLFEFSRISRKELQMSATDMNELVRSVVWQLLEPDRTGIVKIHDLALARGIPAMVKQVFVNLVKNALEFTQLRKAPVIEIGCQPGTTCSTYFVEDNGVGFDMRYGEELFGMIQRPHKGEEFEGLGVGLAVAQFSVQRHTGKIRAEAKVNKGTTMYVTLPGIAGDNND